MDWLIGSRCVVHLSDQSISCIYINIDWMILCDLFIGLLTRNSHFINLYGSSDKMLSVDMLMATSIARNSTGFAATSDRVMPLKQLLRFLQTFQKEEVDKDAATAIISASSQVFLFLYFLFCCFACVILCKLLLPKRSPGQRDVTLWLAQ